MGTLQPSLCRTTVGEGEGEGGKMACRHDRHRRICNIYNDFSENTRSNATNRENHDIRVHYTQIQKEKTSPQHMK